MAVIEAYTRADIAPRNYNGLWDEDGIAFTIRIDIDGLGLDYKFVKALRKLLLLRQYKLNLRHVIQKEYHSHMLKNYILQHIATKTQYGPRQ